MAINKERCRLVAEAIMRSVTLPPYHRPIDADIFEALGYEVTDSHGRMGYAQRGDGPIRFHGGSHWSNMTRFTGNLQRAIDFLIPPGWRVAEMQDGLKSDAGEYCQVALWSPASRISSSYRTNAPTPAAAVCAAAMLAYANGVEGWRRYQ